MTHAAVFAVVAPRQIPLALISQILQRTGRGENYLEMQLAALDVTGAKLGKLFEACDRQPGTFASVLLAYEFGVVDKETIQNWINNFNKPHGLARARAIAEARLAASGRPVALV